MSMSLRDQLLKVGLINKKQANEAERQQQRQERQPPKDRHKNAVGLAPPLAPAGHATKAVRDKAARDQALNRQQQEKAEKKAQLAQIKQLIEQNRLAAVEGAEFYNFVDGTKIRRIGINSGIRERLSRGEIAIVRHDGRYDFVPAAIAVRIRERDERAFIPSAADNDGAAADDAYKEFSVPDDLLW